MTTTGASEHPARAASVEAIRARFPALARRHADRPVAYFDGPGGTQVPRAVVDAMTAYLFHHNANTHWHYPTSAETDAIIHAGRQALADFLNAAPEEIVFGANMTTLTYHVARALGRAWGPGDEIVVTELDHHGNVGPWQALERERGVTLRTARLVTETGQLDWDHFSGLLNDRTRLVAIGAASNAVGTINDVARAGQLAHRAGALSFVDAVHSAPHVLTDVRAIACDFLACSVYKFYGPHLGVLYGPRERLEALDAPKLAPAPDAAPERMETGTQNHEGIAGAAAAVDFLAAIASASSTPPLESRRARLRAAFTVLHERGTSLGRALYDGLKAIDEVTLYGPPADAPRTPTVAFTVRGVPSSEVARRLANEHAVFVSHGDFYAATLVERYGVGPEGFVRAGCACYTTADEVDRLVAGVRAIAASGRRGKSNS